MTDDVEERRDRLIADHVLRMHRYIQPGVEEGTPAHDSLSQLLSIDGPLIEADSTAESQEISPWEKYDPLLHVGIKAAGRNKTPEILSIAFVKKYIQYAKSKPAPALTKGAADWIVSVYADLRNEEMEKNRRHV